jgi:hypothetical protein
MKLPETYFNSRARGRTTAGFTLPEALTATALFSLLVLGVVSVNLFGLRWYQIGQTKMVATDAAREAIGRMSDELRNCNNAIVGNVSNGIFLAPVDGEAQTGNGLLIYTSTNTNTYVIYFLNSTNQDFVRYSTDWGTNTVIAQTVTNTDVFEVQDCLGNVMTNNQNNRVIHCSLQFYSSLPQNPSIQTYQLQTSVAPRSQN